MTVAGDEAKSAGVALGLLGVGSASALGYAALLWLSGQFAAGVSDSEKPTLAMLAIFGGLFLGYWFALWLAVRLPPTRWLVGGIFAAAVLFRGIMLPSAPMHEIDIHRYIWDGAVLAEGISPYRYSPLTVREQVDAGEMSTDETLCQLVELQASSKSLQHSLYAIHFEKYPSPYPLVSQIVFAAAAKLTPDAATSDARLWIMKSLLVLMDLATLAVVMLLVRDVGLHPGWSLAYGWCPLLMKEVANGGHLDSIAIFLTALTIWLLVRGARASQASTRRGVWGGALTGTAMALAIGAKLYPVILVPLLVAVWLRRSGWLAALVGLTVTAVLTAGLLFPLLGRSTASQGEQVDSQIETDAGIRAFLDQWEMNDLLFMVVVENLRPQSNIKLENQPWFVWTSDDWSRSVVTRWARWKQSWGDAKPTDEPLSSSELRAESFQLARLLTGGLFALGACVLAWLAAGKGDPRVWCRAALLTLAWFWLTCPTQNPWYWCWALPFLPFARYRTWYVVAALTMLYYTRFWFTTHYPGSPVLGTRYSGAYFFYYVIAWLEFVPVLVGLVGEWWIWRRGARVDREAASMGVAAN